MDIKITPHRGLKEVPGVGFIEIELDQDFILVDGVRVGIVGRKPDSGIALFGTASPAVIHHIRDAVDKHKGLHLPDRKVAMPPRLGDNASGEKENEQ